MEVKEVKAETVGKEVVFCLHILVCLIDEIWNVENFVEYCMIQYRD